MKTLFAMLLLLMTYIVSTAQEQPELKKANAHAMQYYLSLPQGWNANKKWPVLIVLEAAEKEFKKNAQRFTDARGALPYIIVAPINVNNGSQGRRDPSLWPYSTETWDLIDRQGDCQFNHDGILNIIEDVSKIYNGDSKVFITGFEAGTHALWPLVFEHPDKFKGAVAVAGNYNQKTCIANQVYADSKSKETLPVIGVYGELDQYAKPGSVFFNQFSVAKKAGEDHGFKNITDKMIKGKAHVPMPKEVFEIIQGIR